MEKNWHDAWSYRIGIEYEATSRLKLRAGYVFDEAPDPDEHADYILPDNDTHSFSSGFGLYWQHWRLDLSYTYAISPDRHISARPADHIFESTFDGRQANVVGLTVGYAF